MRRSRRRILYHTRTCRRSGGGPVAPPVPSFGLCYTLFTGHTRWRGAGRRSLPAYPDSPGWGRALSQTAGVCRCGRSGRCGEAQPPRAPPAGTQRLTASWTWFQQGQVVCSRLVPNPASSLLFPALGADRTHERRGALWRWDALIGPHPLPLSRARERGDQSRALGRPNAVEAAPKPFPAGGENRAPPPSGGRPGGGQNAAKVRSLRTIAWTITAMSLANARIASRARIESFLDRTGANGPVRPWRNMEP